MAYHETQFWSFMKQLTNDFHFSLQCLWKSLVNHLLPKIIIHNEPYIILHLLQMLIYGKRTFGNYR